MIRMIRALAGGVLTVLLLSTPAVAAPPFPDTIALPNGWRPEGISLGPGTTFFVGSLANGAILRGDLRTGSTDVLVSGSPGMVAVGTEYEAGAKRLWAVGGATGEVRAYDARTGALLAAYDFDGGFLNDLAVTRDAVYVTDSIFPQLHVIPLGPRGALPAAGDTFQLALTGDLRIEPGFNLNGIVETRGLLVAVQTNTGMLLRIDPASGESTAIDLGGRTVDNGDGLQVLGSTLYVVRNVDNRVDVYRLGARLATASFIGSLASDSLNVPTTAVARAGSLWVVNAAFTTPPTPSTPYWLTRLPLRP